MQIISFIDIGGIMKKKLYWLNYCLERACGVSCQLRKVAATKWATSLKNSTL